MKFNIQIKKLDCLPVMDDLINVITKVHWSLVGKLNNKEYSMDIVTQLSVDYTNSSNFIEYSNLNQNTIIGWLDSLYDGRIMNEYKNFLIKSFEENQDFSIINLDLPWEKE
jgi:hypothetical protein